MKTLAKDVGSINSKFSGLRDSQCTAREEDFGRHLGRAAKQQPSVTKVGNALPSSDLAFCRSADPIRALYFSEIMWSQVTSAFHVTIPCKMANCKNKQAASRTLGKEDAISPRICQIKQPRKYKINNFLRSNEKQRVFLIQASSGSRLTDGPLEPGLT